MTLPRDDRRPPSPVLTVDRTRRSWLWLVPALLASLSLWLQAGDEPAPARTKSPAKAAAPDKPAAAGEREPAGDDAVKEIVSGQVVPLAAALKARGIKSYAEETKDQFVLVTDAQELIPIVPDWRGRAFYQDERLRERPVDLVVHRRPGVPWVQVLSIYTFDDKGKRQLTDYWCDVCSIPMYEIKDCECCQGPTRLRFRTQDLPKDVRRHSSSQ